MAAAKKKPAKRKKAAPKEPTLMERKRDIEQGILILRNQLAANEGALVLVNELVGGAEKDNNKRNLRKLKQKGSAA